MFSQHNSPKAELPRSVKKAQGKPQQKFYLPPQKRKRETKEAARQKQCLAQQEPEIAIECKVEVSSTSQEDAALLHKLRQEVRQRHLLLQRQEKEIADLEARAKPLQPISEKLCKFFSSRPTVSLDPFSINAPVSLSPPKMEQTKMDHDEDEGKRGFACD